jgi:hypothetical protein
MIEVLSLVEPNAAINRNNFPKSVSKFRWQLRCPPSHLPFLTENDPESHAWLIKSVFIAKPQSEFIKRGYTPEVLEFVSAWCCSWTNCMEQQHLCPREVLHWRLLNRPGVRDDILIIPYLKPWLRRKWLWVLMLSGVSFIENDTKTTVLR